MLSTTTTKTTKRPRCHVDNNKEEEEEEEEERYHQQQQDARDDEDRAILLDLLMSPPSPTNDDERSPSLSAPFPLKPAFDCMAITLKLRAECGDDLWKLMGLLPALESAPVLWRVHLNLEFFNCGLTLQLRAAKARAPSLLASFVRELLVAIATIEDGHVMRETLNFADEYNGERAPSGHALERALQGKLTPVVFS